MSSLEIINTSTPTTLQETLFKRPTSTAGVASRIFSGCKSCMPPLSGRVIWGIAALTAVTLLFVYYVQGKQKAALKMLNRFLSVVCPSEDFQNTARSIKKTYPDFTRNLVISLATGFLPRNCSLSPREHAKGCQTFLKRVKDLYPDFDLDIQDIDDALKNIETDLDETVTSILTVTLIPKVNNALTFLRPAQP